MSNLDRIVRHVSAFSSFADLQASMAGGYVPSVYAHHGPVHVALRLALTARDLPVFPPAR